MVSTPIDTESPAVADTGTALDAFDIDADGTAGSPAAWRRNLNLVRELAITQFKLKYTGSVLGYLWSLIKPLMIFAMLYAIFAVVLKAGAGTENFPMQLLLGIVLYNFFAETTVISVSAVVGNGHIIKKAFFPRVILVVAATMTASMTFVINMSLIVVIGAAIGKLSLGWQSLALLPLLVELYALTLGIGLILSALFVFYRDLGHVWEVLIQLLFYASAVVFPLTLVHDVRKLRLLAINPLAQIIEDARHAVVTQAASVPWTEHILGAAWPAPMVLTLGILVLGFVVFHRLTPRFAEYL